MKIWLVETGEPLPTDENPGRLWRAGMVAEQLWRRGHDVTWWASTFDHLHKRYRADASRSIDYRERYSLRLLHGVPYDRGVSATRLLNHHQVAREFSRLARDEARPDGIFCCVPTLDLADAAVTHGAGSGVPVILDYRDLWPDIFADPFPALLRPMVRVLSWPWRRMARRAFGGAAAITGITDVFVDRALAYSRRSRDEGRDRSFPHAYPEVSKDEAGLADGLRFWEGLGIRRGGGEFVICYFGQLSRRHEIETAIQAVREMHRGGCAVRLVLCGKGEMERQCREWAGNSTAILIPGFVDSPKIQALMSLSHAGILPYPSTPDFAVSIPNKVIEYLAGGLPVLSSVRGIVSDLLRDEDAGLTYENGNANSLIDAINRYLQDPRLRARQADNAGRVFRLRFSAEKVYAEMAGHIERVFRCPARLGH